MADAQKTAAEAMQQLQDGNVRYVGEQMKRELQDSGRRAELAAGQWPWAIILTCADSRVTPELIFDSGIGELFVVRVAGNIANTSSMASIEYAVHALGVKLIVVLGHESCGAVKAALNGADLGDNLNHLVGHITPCLADPFESDDQLAEAVERNARRSAAELNERSAIISGAEGLPVAPAVYRLASGQVDFL